MFFRKKISRNYVLRSIKNDKKEKNIVRKIVSVIGIAASQDQLRLVICQYFGGILYSTRANTSSSFTTFTATQEAENYFICKVYLTTNAFFS